MKSTSTFQLEAKGGKKKKDERYIVLSKKCGFLITQGELRLSRDRWEKLFVRKYLKCKMKDL